jgi:hypothetical protein
VNEMFTLEASVRESPSVVLKRVRTQLNRLQERSIALSPSLLQQVKDAHANQGGGGIDDDTTAPMMWGARMYVPDVPPSVSNSHSASPSYYTPILGGRSGKAPAAAPVRAIASAPLPRRTLEYASSSFDALHGSDGATAADADPHPCHRHRHRAASEPVLVQTTQTIDESL